MGNKQEKVYKIYETKDGRRELFAKYATSEAFVMCEGELIEKRDNVTVRDLEEMTAALERYDESVAEAEG